MIRLYMDVHVPGPITRGLRQRGVDVLTAQEDGTDEFLDPTLLDRARELGRILFTQDDDLLGEAALRHATGASFAGVIYIHQRKLRIGRCIDDLQLIAMASDPEEWADRVQYLPL